MSARNSVRTFAAVMLPTTVENRTALEASSVRFTNFIKEWLALLTFRTMLSMSLTGHAGKAQHTLSANLRTPSPTAVLCSPALPRTIRPTRAIRYAFALLLLPPPLAILPFRALAVFLTAFRDSLLRRTE